jgi:hypothetical protein
MEGLEDPVDVVASPFNNAALVVSGFGDGIFALDYSPDTSPPFSVRGEISYMGSAPQLPANAVMIDRGDLSGLVLVAENLGVRRVRFETDGSITDLGLEPLGSGPASITGAIGVQP